MNCPVCDAVGTDVAVGTDGAGVLPAPLLDPPQAVSAITPRNIPTTTRSVPAPRSASLLVAGLKSCNSACMSLSNVVAIARTGQAHSNEACWAKIAVSCGGLWKTDAIDGDVTQFYLALWPSEVSALMQISGRGRDGTGWVSARTPCEKPR